MGLEKCVGTKGPTCNQRWRDICWDLCWWASFKRFPIDRMTMWNGSIVSFWTLEVDPFSSCQMMFPICPEFALPKWYPDLSQSYFMVDSARFRLFPPCISYCVQWMKGHGGRRCPKTCKYQHGKMPRGSVAISMGHLGGFAIEDGSKKVANMVLRHLALDAESFTVLCWFFAFIQNDAWGETPVLWRLHFHRYLSEYGPYSPPVNESPINSAHFLSYGSFTWYVEYWTASILVAISKYFEHISARNGEQGELTLDLEEQRCFVLDGESGATIRELARWVGNYSKCFGKNLIFHKQPKSLINFDYFGKVAGCWWGKYITLRWRWSQFDIFQDFFWKSPAEASIL